MDVKEYLKEIRINFKEFKHEAVFTVEESKKSGIHEKLKGLHTKNLFLKSKKKEAYYLVVMPAEKRLDIKKLEEEINEKLTFANANELKEILGLTPGSVSPFGLINDKSVKVKLLVDKEVMDAKVVGFHPNINTATLELTKEDFQKFLSSIKNNIKVI